MRPASDCLGKDARALIRAARGGDAVSAEERQRLLATFASRRATEEAAGAERGSPRRGWLHRRAAPRLSWAVAALVLSGSLAALAQHQRLFQRLGAWLEPAPPEAALQDATWQDGAERRGKPPGDGAAPATPPPHLDAVPELTHDGALHEPPAASVAAERATARISPARPSSAPARAARTPGAAQGFDSAELELIAAARSALAERRFDSARQHAQQHASRFPHGAFSEEREAILALCECRSRRGSQRGKRFVEERPGSLLAERVRRDCGLGANPVPGAQEPDTH